MTYFTPDGRWPLLVWTSVMEGFFFYPTYCLLLEECSFDAMWHLMVTYFTRFFNQNSVAGWTMRFTISKTNSTILVEETGVLFFVLFFSAFSGGAGRVPVRRCWRAQRNDDFIEIYWTANGRWVASSVSSPFLNAAQSVAGRARARHLFCRRDPRAAANGKRPADEITATPRFGLILSKT